MNWWYEIWILANRIRYLTNLSPISLVFYTATSDTATDPVASTPAREGTSISEAAKIESIDYGHGQSLPIGRELQPDEYLQELGSANKSEADPAQRKQDDVVVEPKPKEDLDFQRRQSGRFLTVVMCHFA